LILVDDASADETPHVVQELIRRYPGIIHYERNESNRKQAFSKNRGKSFADTEYVYFGDDDSILAPGSLAALCETMEAESADITGASAVYCRAGESPAQAQHRYISGPVVSDPSKFVDLRRLRFGFDQRSSRAMALPVTHAAMLVRRSWYQRIDFDIRYAGNCYREETDFVLQASSAGAKVVFDGRAIQINLPPNETRGGARSSHRAKYEWHCLVNTVRFLRKHRSYYREELGISPAIPLLWYAWDRLVAAGRKLSA
jgi:glycosyltransferase involved in cell wall biosynthesis